MTQTVRAADLANEGIESGGKPSLENGVNPVIERLGPGTNFVIPNFSWQLELALAKAARPPQERQVYENALMDGNSFLDVHALRLAALLFFKCGSN